MSVTETKSPQKSGAAGSATFAGSDSRKYNYFEPKGRKASHYEDMTVDVQPDPERYLLQDWIINFADGTPTYDKNWTALKSSNWHQFRAVDQEWERTHYQRQSTIVGMISNLIENGRRSGAPKRFDRAWVKVLSDHLGAYKHAEFGLGTATMQAQRYGYTQMINNAILTNSSYKLRFSQDLTLYLGELALDIEGVDLDAGKQHWLEDPIWQGTRHAIEAVMGATDYLEQYFATNIVFEPLVGELFRSGFVMQMAAAQNDFMTPAVVAAAEGDYERNLANAVELFHILVLDPEHGDSNRAILVQWMHKHGSLALDAAHHLQPIWSQPRVKIAQFADALDLAKNRVRAIAAEIGFDVRATLDQ
ncbi:MAG: toluene hydroxylase [Acidiphilium sp. 37-64-53]|uniref:aromatic/alkene monooxygenase hydroxylase subunit beta n=1 Tax=Acidiphilium TaxID=522 RepID=UPI000BCA430C|nr:MULTISPECIES: aromatic/alkene monooxygenase hydroxylase subunit beta [Acidiphilium]MBW4033850.1 toluene hydroxylase [Pseudomonadota bacterium]OYW01541.1 MAG: toluene hydroxylase [Acidiphilium sp. 37-64-53]OZB29280.1 MAG: toluene hydroxylase [Acidiphilium sp. 34-64-41]HQT86395.1 aromatic/alkene monooxygenase hydroxylase subunit beta [Acidiphilium rubrum]